MFAFKERLQQTGFLYLRKSVQDAGFREDLEVVPEKHAIVIFPSGKPLSQVRESVSAILQHIELQILIDSQTGATLKIPVGHGD